MSSTQSRTRSRCSRAEKFKRNSWQELLYKQPVTKSTKLKINTYMKFSQLGTSATMYVSKPSATWQPGEKLLALGLRFLLPVQSPSLTGILPGGNISSLQSNLKLRHLLNGQSQPCSKHCMCQRQCHLTKGQEELIKITKISSIEGIGAYAEALPICSS